MIIACNALRRRAGGLIAILSALGSSACAGSPALDEETGDSTMMETRWTHVVPGVWERAVPEGGRERMSVGLDGLRFDIAAAEARQVTLEQRDGSADDTTELQANAQFLADLRSVLDEIAAPVDGNMAPPLPPSLDGGGGFDPEDQPYGPMSVGKPGVMCNGSYHLEVTITNLWHNHYVDASASWSEFGPFPTFVKHMSTYAWAVGGNQIPVSDDDQKSFAGSCCEYVSSSAAAAVTFTPQLYGAAYLGVDNGCYGSDFVSYSRGL